MMRVLVTGGASGLGAAVVAAVQADGGTPIVLDRTAPLPAAPHEPAAENVPEHIVVDLSDREVAEGAVREAADRLGGLDAVVTCAGTDACGKLEDIPGKDWDRVIAVNLLGTAAVVRAALPSLVESHGKVVTVASTLGLRALSDATAYCASKFGVVGFTRALQVEMQGKVGVTMLVPGGMSTAFFDDRDPQYKPGEDAQLNDPANVAAAALFALKQPPGCEVRELLITPSTEPSWP